MFLNGSQFQESGSSWFLTMYLCAFDLTGSVKCLLVLRHGLCVKHLALGMNFMTRFD